METPAKTSLSNQLQSLDGNKNILVQRIEDEELSQAVRSLLNELNMTGNHFSVFCESGANPNHSSIKYMRFLLKNEYVQKCTTGSHETEFMYLGGTDSAFLTILEHHEFQQTIIGIPGDPMKTFSGIKPKNVAENRWHNIYIPETTEDYVLYGTTSNTGNHNIQDIDLNYEAYSVSVEAVFPPPFMGSPRYCLAVGQLVDRHTEGSFGVGRNFQYASCGHDKARLYAFNPHRFSGWRDSGDPEVLRARVISAAPNRPSIGDKIEIIYWDNHGQEMRLVLELRRP